MFRQLMFLAWESPWPAYSGGGLRTFGLLKELSKAFEVELVVMSRYPLSDEQTAVLKKYSHSIIRVPLMAVTFKDKFNILKFMLKYVVPYHCAIIRVAFASNPSILKLIQNFKGIVYASYGHWGTIAPRQASNWILDQHNADVHFWRVYASQATNYFIKVAALINWWFADKHFRKIYQRVTRIVSVCEQDKQLTLELNPQLQIDVIANGVDCSYYVPDRKTQTSHPPRILFTGTSAARNMFALHKFVRNVFPLIKQKIPDVELLVAGNFHSKAQAQFSSYHGIRFTGQVDDMRPFFNQSDVFIAPFEETHGSKLKIGEAMAMGMPIVSTPEGIRGFPLVNNESVLIASSDQQFASQVVTLLTDSALRERIGKEARRIAENFIDWKVLGKRLVQIVNSMYEKENRKYIKTTEC